MGKEKGLDKCIIPNSGTQVSDKMVATTVEAVIGAAYIDAGDEGLAKVVEAFRRQGHEYLISANGTDQVISGDQP